MYPGWQPLDLCVRDGLVSSDRWCDMLHSSPSSSPHPASVVHISTEVHAYFCATPRISFVAHAIVPPWGIVGQGGWVAMETMTICDNESWDAAGLRRMRGSMRDWFWSDQNNSHLHSETDREQIFELTELVTWYRWVSARKTSLQCVSNGVTSFFH